MTDHPPFGDWQAVLNAPHSAFFRGHTSDTVFDRQSAAALSPHMEALFTQSNARVLLGQAADGRLRFVALPTQVYAAPTGSRELGLGPGMYHHFDVAMYVGDLSYRIEPEGGEPADLAAEDRQNETWYADWFLPLTRTRAGDLEVALISLAPVAPEAEKAALAPAPLPGPAGALYLLRLRNSGASAIRGRVVLRAGDLLVGHYEDAAPEVRPLKKPAVDLRQHTLILSRPDGAVGIHAHEARWARLEAPYEAEWALNLAPGEEALYETTISLGRTYHEVMPTVYALHLHPALEWLNNTAAFWRERLGRLTVDAEGASEEARFSLENHIRNLLDNFNCLQTDAEGNLIAHWQGAPSHGYGTIWGIDVEPTAVSVNQVCPELARQTMLFFLERSRAPIGLPEHSVPILVAPVIIARQWLQATGDVEFLAEHPAVMEGLQSIMDDLEALRAPGEELYPSRYSSDGPVGRRYDYGTNVKALYALSSYAYLLQALGRGGDAAYYRRRVDGVRCAIERTMVAEGPFGPQLSGGTNLDEDPAGFYLPEGVLYYDGEDTSSMLAAVYGACDLTWEPWVNYHRFARSLWCPNYDPEFDVLRWSPGESGVFDGTAFYSRLGGSVTRAEMAEALHTLRRIGTDDATGSTFWWPHGLEFRRGLTRCSQGQGAWAWQYREQWLGLKVDVLARTLTLAPRGLLSRIDWEGLRAGPACFDVHWLETGGLITARVRNRNPEPWRLGVGFRRPGAGAEGGLSWQERTLSPGEEVTLAHMVLAPSAPGGMERTALVQHEAALLGDPDGVLFQRFGPATLWGHWEVDRWWDPRAMPLAVRFVVLNATTADWHDVSVTLRLPPGWLAQARPAQHWPRPDRLTGGEVRAELGTLPRRERTVAAFWVRAPHGIDMGKAFEGGEAPFHAVSQPGPGLRLPSPDVSAPVETSLEAELIATGAEGKTVRRQLAVPVQIVPCSQRG